MREIGEIYFDLLQHGGVQVTKGESKLLDAAAEKVSARIQRRSQVSICHLENSQPVDLGRSRLPLLSEEGTP